MGDRDGAEGFRRGRLTAAGESHAGPAEGDGSRIGDTIVGSADAPIVVQVQGGVIDVEGGRSREGTFGLQYGGVAVDQCRSRMRIRADDGERILAGADPVDGPARRAGPIAGRVVLIDDELSGAARTGDIAAGTRITTTVREQASNLLVEAGQIERRGRASHDQELARSISIGGTQAQGATCHRQVARQGVGGKSGHAGFVGRSRKHDDSHPFLHQSSGARNRARNRERRTRVSMEHALDGGQRDHWGAQHVRGGAGREQAARSQREGRKGRTANSLSRCTGESHRVHDLARRQRLGRHGGVGVDGVGRAGAIQVRRVSRVVIGEGGDASRSIIGSEARTVDGSARQDTPRSGHKSGGGREEDLVRRRSEISTSEACTRISAERKAGKRETDRTGTGLARAENAARTAKGKRGAVRFRGIGGVAHIGEGAALDRQGAVDEARGCGAGGVADIEHAAAVNRDSARRTERHSVTAEIDGAAVDIERPGKGRLVGGDVQRAQSDDVRTRTAASDRARQVDDGVGGDGVEVRAIPRGDATREGEGGAGGRTERRPDASSLRDESGERIAAAEREERAPAVDTGGPGSRRQGEGVGDGHPTGEFIGDGASPGSRQRARAQRSRVADAKGAARDRDGASQGGIRSREDQGSVIILGQCIRRGRERERRGKGECVARSDLERIVRLVEDESARGGEGASSPEADIRRPIDVQADLVAGVAEGAVRARRQDAGQDIDRRRGAAEGVAGVGEQERARARLGEVIAPGVGDHAGQGQSRHDVRSRRGTHREVRGAVERDGTRELEAEAAEIGNREDAAWIRQVDLLEGLITSIRGRTRTVHGDGGIIGQDDIATEGDARRSTKRIAVTGEDKAAGRRDSARIVTDDQDA